MLQRSSAAQAQSLLSPPSRTVAPRARRTTVPRRSPGPYPRPCSSHSPSARRPGEVFAHQQQQPSPWSSIGRSRRPWSWSSSSSSGSSSSNRQPAQSRSDAPRAVGAGPRAVPKPAPEPRMQPTGPRAVPRPASEPRHAGPSAARERWPKSRRCSRCSSKPAASRATRPRAVRAGPSAAHPAGPRAARQPARAPHAQPARVPRGRHVRARVLPSSYFVLPTHYNAGRRAAPPQARAALPAVSTRAAT